MHRCTFDLLFDWFGFVQIIVVEKVVMPFHIEALKYNESKETKIIIFNPILYSNNNLIVYIHHK